MEITNIPKSILVLVLALFTVLTGLALNQLGFVGIFQGQFQNFGGMQVLVDLGIACTLLLVWMWNDAQKNNQSFWPFFVITLVAGCYGPLLYLLFRKPQAKV